ncbi:GNAT family N-acetyltransferase [Pediococcus damnosus]|nr:GNAT family N-acetyltransferase [Pediococcus damnosus]KJU74354.1 hypothetical protein AH70_07115 [Pediococcus damnosus LMG 28219]KRN52746.1 hypothetical protein IV84_GL000559 [Pediococcus damnosus]GEA93051.1 hypothetical protein PDA01_09440 [Pediococcus damnosus]
MIKVNDIVSFYTISASYTPVLKNWRKKHLSLNTGRTSTTYLNFDISFFAVNSKYQDSGMGRLTMKHLLLNTYSRLMPVVGVSLVTLDALKTAVDFYTRLGFIEYSQEPMRKSITPLAIFTSDIGNILDLKKNNHDKEIDMLEGSLKNFVSFKKE